jgi:hypothetical protein
MRAAIPSTGSLDAGRRTVAVGLVVASAMRRTGDAICMVDDRPVHQEVSATVAGEAGSIRRKRERNDDGSAI